MRKGNNMTTTEKNHAKEQAKAQLESIKEMVDALNKCRKADQEGRDDYRQLEEAEQAIQEDPLSVEIRSDWFTPGDAPEDFGEFKILLCTGGPAVRIIGTLDGGQPETARIEYQDWGTPWTEYRITAEEADTLLTYCRCFYFGE